MTTFLNKAFYSLQMHIKETQPEDVSFTILLSIIIKFITQSWQVNTILFVVLLLLIAINTWSGARLARKKKEWSLKIFKEKLVSKCIGYFILIIAVSMIVILLFVASLKDGANLIPEYYLNLVVIITFVLLGIFEFKSTLDNLKEYGTHIPDFLNKFATKVEDKANEIIK
jgi:phage-related holin